MSLKLITGSANSGKTGEVLRYAQSALDAGRRPTILVPTGPDVERLRRELSRRLPLGVRCTRFDPYVESLWASRGDGRRIVTRHQRRLLLMRGAEPLNGGKGLIRVAESVLRELTAPAEPDWRGAPLSQAECGDLGQLLAFYASELAERRLLECDEAAHILMDKGHLPHHPIIFHRFSELSGVQEEFVRTACSVGADTLVTLTWVEGRVATEAFDLQVQRLSQLAEEHLRLDPAEYTTSRELRRLEETLFERPEIGEPDGAIVFSTGEGDEAEEQRVVEEVEQLLEAGRAHESIAVASRDAAGEIVRFRRALEDSGIACDVDAELPLTSSPFGRSLRALLRYAISHNREDVLLWLRSGYATRRSQVVSRLEKRWRAGGVHDHRVIHEDLAGVDEVAGGFLEIALESPETPVGTHRWLDLCAHMLRTRWGVDAYSLEADRDYTAHASVLAILDDVMSLKEAHLGLGEFAGILADATVSQGRVDRPGRVQLVDVLRIRGRRFESVVLAGLNAGAFPAPGSEALLSPQVKAVLRCAGVGVARPWGLSEERALYYGVVTRARSRLILSRRSTDADGLPLGSSIFWEETLDMYRDPSRGEMDCPGLPQRHRHMGEELTPVAWDTDRTARPVARRIADASLLEHLSSRQAFSASELELYARCPRRWFTERALRAHSLDFELGGAQLGSIAHAAMAKAYPMLGELGSDRDQSEAKEDRLKRVAWAATQRACEEAGLPDAAAGEARERTAPKVLRTLRTDSDILPGFAPAHFELKLGEGDADYVSMGGFSLSGRVDRIDEDAGGRLVVVDYKSGRVGGYRRVDVKQMMRIQVPLYMAAVAKTMPGRVVGGLYRSMADGATRGLYDSEDCPSDGLTRTDAEDDMAGTLEWAVTVAAEAVEGIRAGVIRPAETDEHCAYCPAIHSCEGGAW